MRWEWMRRVSRAWECSVVEDVACKVHRWWLSVGKQVQGDWHGRDSGRTDCWVNNGKLKPKEEGSASRGDRQADESKESGLYNVELVGWGSSLAAPVENDGRGVGCELAC